LARLSQRQDDLSSDLELVLIPVSILVALITAGGIVGTVFSFRSEARAGQLHDLQVAGESSQQARTEETHAVLLDASQKTLTLVNDTLKLARDASDRASKALSERAERMLAEITEDATDLFTTARWSREFETSHYKHILDDAHIRHEINDLSQRLGAIEGYLRLEDIPLTASAYLVKGLNHHLRQDEKRSIQNFDNAIEAKDPSGDRIIKQYAYYWMGHACTNIGLYRRAIDIFRTARSFADKPTLADYELARRAEESTFYELVNSHLERGEGSDTASDIVEAERLIHNLGELSAAARKSGVTVAAEALTLSQGNIWTWIARVRGGRSADTKRAWRNASDSYKVAGEALWARFGLLEARAALSPNSIVVKDYARIERDADRLAHDRAEPRSKTLLLLGTVLCMRRRKRGRAADAELRSAMRHLIDAFSEVDGSLTLYSEYWKANVSRAQFITTELDPIHALDSEQAWR
jgi:tetratricopeptide (TPR) repeat protein